MMKFTQKRNKLTAIVLIASLLVSGVAFANEDVREKIVSIEKKEVTTKEAAKNELLDENLHEFNFNLEIKRIEQTEEDIRVVYQFNSFLQNNSWQEDRKEQTLVIAKDRVQGEDELKTYVNNELLEVIEQERFYLKKLQKREQELAVAVEDTQDVIEVSVLNGLFDLSFDAPIEEIDTVSQVNDSTESSATTTASSTQELKTVALVPLLGFKSSLPTQPKTEVLAEAGRIGDGEDAILTLDEWVNDVAAAETEEELDAILDIDPETLPSDPETPAGDAQEDLVAETSTTTEDVAGETTPTSTSSQEVAETTATTTDPLPEDEPEEESTIIVTTGTTTDETIIIQESEPVVEETATSTQEVVEEAPVTQEEPDEVPVAQEVVQEEPAEDLVEEIVVEEPAEESTIILTGEQDPVTE